MDELGLVLKYITLYIIITIITMYIILGLFILCKFVAAKLVNLWM